MQVLKSYSDSRYLLIFSDLQILSANANVITSQLSFAVSNLEMLNQIRPQP